MAQTRQSVAIELRDFSWDRMIEAVQAVRERRLVPEHAARLKQLLDDPDG